MELDELIIHTDGASRGNPGEAGIGVVFLDSEGTVVSEICDYLGQTTNNVAEYQALIRALEAAREMGARRLRVRTDSELMVRQIEGRYRVKNDGLIPLFRRVKDLIRGFESVEVTYVPREANRQADALANRGIDQASKG